MHRCCLHKLPKSKYINGIISENCFQNHFTKQLLMHFFTNLSFSRVIYFPPPANFSIYHSSSQCVLPHPLCTCAIIKASSSWPLLLKKVTSFFMSPVATLYGIASSLSSAISWSALLQHEHISITDSYYMSGSYCEQHLSARDVNV